MDVKIEGDLRGQSRECGPTTQLRIFATLRAALNAAVKQRKIPWNPCDGVELEQPETAELQRWTPAEAVQFIDATADDRYTHPLEQAHLAAAEQTAALVRRARKAA
jgi:hypothetical protein